MEIKADRNGDGTFRNRVYVFRSRYSSKADDTVEEVEFWEGIPKGPSRLLLPGITFETAAKFFHR